LSVITEILDRLSGVEVLKEKLRDTASRVEEWAGAPLNSTDRSRTSIVDWCGSKRSLTLPG